MNTKIDKIKNFRLYLLKQVEGLTAQQFNHIPQGYSNNIVWNVGHLISAQQNMCYVRAGLPITVDDLYFSPYISGTKPSAVMDDQEIVNLKDLLITSIDRFQSDFDKAIFQNYSPSVMIPKVYGFEVPDIDEAIEYLLHHEGYHLGCILSLKRFV